MLRRLAVVAGGPGTGKTTTVARIVALLVEQAVAAGAPPPLVALAAPTGKAAARLEEAVHEEAERLAVDEPTRERLRALQASTLHRLLGWRPGSHSRFRHHRGNRLPHDVVVVDETSMVSLSLMARLVESVRPEARLVLVGDPGQLASIEAGAVLGDIVGPAAEGLILRPAARDALAAATGREVEAAEPPAGAAGIGDGIVVLDRVYRYDEGIGAIAAAIRAGDADGLLDALEAGREGVTWLPVDVADPDALEALAPVREGAVATARTVIEAARAGRAAEAIAGARRPPRAVRAPPGRARRRDLDGADRGLAGGRGRRLRRRGAVVPRASAAGDRERLRAAALQRRHGRRRDDRSRAGDRRVRAPRRGARVQPRPARRGGDRVRDDRAQEPGLAVRHRRRAASRRRRRRS